MKRRTSRGFSLIEALVALVLAGVGIASLVGAMGVIDKAEAQNLRAEKMQRLAIDKLDEIIAIKDFDTTSGDFSDRGETDFEWTMTDDTTSVTSLDHVKVTVSMTNSPDVQRSVSKLVYKVPVSTGGTQ